MVSRRTASPSASVVAVAAAAAAAAARAKKVGAAAAPLEAAAKAWVRAREARVLGALPSWGRRRIVRPEAPFEHPERSKRPVARDGM